MAMFDDIFNVVPALSFSHQNLLLRQWYAMRRRAIDKQTFSTVMKKSKSVIEAEYARAHPKKRISDLKIPSS
jgi:hypothetical protein